METLRQPCEERRATSPPSSSYVVLDANAPLVAMQLRDFVRTWNVQDRLARFGNAALSSLEWLNDAFAAGRQRGIVATENGRIVALLDYTLSSTAAEPGILIAKGHRRRGLGRRLMLTFLDIVSGTNVRAHSLLENQAAGALLATCGFQVEWHSAGELQWAWHGWLAQECTVPSRLGKPAPQARSAAVRFAAPAPQTLEKKPEGTERAQRIADPVLTLKRRKVEREKQPMTIRLTAGADHPFPARHSDRGKARPRRCFTISPIRRTRRC